MVNYCRIAASLLLISFCALSAFAQSDGSADTSAAQAAIQSIQASSQAPPKTSQAFPALKAASCKTAVPYVESPSGLLGDWDLAMKKYTIDRDGGLAITEKARQNLLSDAFWRTSSAATVANYIHTFCKLANDAISAAVPGGNSLKAAISVSEDFGAEVSRRAVHVYELLDKGDQAAEVLKSDADELVVWGAKEAAKQAGYGRAISAIDAIEDIANHIRTGADAADYEATVQQQIQSLNSLINRYQYDMMMQRQQLIAIEALKDAVIAACNADQPTQAPPLFLNPTDTSQPLQNASSGETAPTEPVTPWWVNIKPITLPSSALKPRLAIQPQAPAQPQVAMCGDRPLKPTDRVCP
jgi:hypothetical protein